MSKVIVDKEKIEEILKKGVEEIFVKKDLEKALYSGKKLRIKLGIDPTSPYIHLGRAVPLRKLKAFQDLGHTIVFIIGDYTARIGDPSDKLEKRPMLTEVDIKNNLKKYLKQVGLILNMRKVEVKYNSKWFKKMNFIEIGKLLECFTVQQMTKRRNFRERLEIGSDIFMIEFLYPALQGYDSVMVKSDVEIGGFDQLFNLKAGRIIQKKYNQKEQNIMTLSMIEGTDGRKMSSSWGNIISIVDTPDEMFGKIMSLKDELILRYFNLATDLSLKEIEKIEASLNEGKNPMVFKKQLGIEIVNLYHSEKKALLAKENWENIFSKKEIPTNIKNISINKDDLLIDIFTENKIVISKSEFRRLVDEKAITNLNTKEKITSHKEKAKNGVYRIGKKRFVKIILE